MTTTDAKFALDTACYLRVNNGLDHSEWCLEASSLSPDAMESIHHFCAAQRIEASGWSFMARRPL